MSKWIYKALYLGGSYLGPKSIDHKDSKVAPYLKQYSSLHATSLHLSTSNVIRVTRCELAALLYLTLVQDATSFCCVTVWGQMYPEVSAFVTHPKLAFHSRSLSPSLSPLYPIAAS